MFFTPELLSRRDSGFGLMWLSATLGTKSSFKKLHKRNVMNADITELCDLITEPTEPLALRLSSNLMVGLVRIYKVKHEMFLGDVTAFHAILKKAIQDTAATALDLQMNHPVVRADVVTMAADPALVTGFDYDDYLDRWPDEEDRDDVGSDDEYGKRKRKNKRVPAAENPRADLHILDENMDLLLSGSFDASQLGSLPGYGDRSSSQADAIMGFDVYEDDIFKATDSFDMGEIGDELAQELGLELPSALPTQDHTIQENMMDIDLGAPQDFAMDLGDEFMFPPLVEPSDDAITRLPGSSITSARKRPFAEPEPRPRSDNIVGHDTSGTPQVDEYARSDNLPADELDEIPKTGSTVRKAKRVRLLLDARIELTDEELKASRSHYLEVQSRARREIEHKKLEKESARIIEEMLWGVPRGLQAPGLADFWREHVREKAVIRPGIGLGELQTPRRSRSVDDAHKDPSLNTSAPTWGDMADTGLQYDDPFVHDVNIYNDHDEPGAASYIGSAQQRSSEEPGQARRGSLPPSPLGGQFDFALRQAEPTSASQRSAVFPWDHAGPSSSSAGGHFDLAHDEVNVGHQEVRIRRASSAGSRSRRDSSVISGQVVGRGFSPSAFQRLGSQVIGEDFEFEVPEENISHPELTRDAAEIKLERNSFNFLEYTRMQARTVSQSADGLTFDAIAPTATSTKHIAAAAFYHCLVLAGKELIRVHQTEPYGEIMVHIV